jgi:hypothetical protein
MTRLSSFGTLGITGEPVSIEDVAGIELTITDFAERKGEFGEFLAIQAHDADDVEYLIVTGASLIVEALREAKQKHSLPVEAKFVRKGRVWLAE